MADKKRAWLGRVFFGATLAVVTAAVVFVHNDYLACVQCYVLKPITTPVPWEEKFLNCSNIDQSIDWSSSHNVKQQTGEVPAWTVLAPDDPSKEAQVVVRFKKNAGQRRVVFYPRAGEGAEVAVHEDIRFPRRLFLLQGATSKWTPLGGQYPFDFLCLEYGFQTRKQFDARVVIQLKGQWAQLWIKDGKVFF